jgi:hypothetical protein
MPKTYERSFAARRLGWIVPQQSRSRRRRSRPALLRTQLKGPALSWPVQTWSVTPAVVARAGRGANRERTRVAEANFSGWLRIGSQPRSAPELTGR